MLHLIAGPSGSGKTMHLVDRIRADIRAGIRCFLLVPEQQAYISERDLPDLLPANAGLHFSIVNFSSLAENVFSTYGGITDESISTGVRTLLMWNTLRTLPPLLQRYGTGADAALTERMLRTVAELRADGIDAARLEDAANAMEKSSPLQKKLHDIALIDSSYHAAIEECFGQDPADKLDRLHALLREHRYFAGCHIYVDSFTDFTVPEYRVLSAILRQADEVFLTLCTDHLHSTLPHFDSAVRTARRLRRLADTADVPVAVTELCEKQPSRTPALSCVERALWDFSAPVEAIAADDSVRLYTCANVYEEAEAAALRICELVANGVRYGDIAVIARDAETYRGILDAALEKQGIPYFFSERTDLSAKPLCRLLLAALRAVSRHWRQEDIIELLKTGLCGIPTRDSALFEEYCATWHISGSRFTDPVWSMNPDGMTTERSARAEEILLAANKVRKLLMDPLLALAADMRLSRRTEDRCRALYAYLCRLDVASLLSARAKEELRLGNTRAAGETVRLWDTVTEALTTLCRLLPQEELSQDEFITALSLLLSNSDMGSIPTTADCVVIGSASTLRLENVRASILLGLCEGEFPAAVTDDGILTDADKSALEEFGVTFDSHAPEKSAQELFFVYRAMTKPKESLTLFTVSQSTDGSARAPSQAFLRVARLLSLRTTVLDMHAIRRAAGEASDYSEGGKLAAAPIRDAVTLTLSQSKIRTFVLCPYSYYSTYQLKLRERKDATPDYSDDGVFLHHVFEQFLRHALCEDGTLRLPDEEETERMADAIMEAYLESIFPFAEQGIDRRLLHLFARLRKLAQRMLKDILDEIRASRFLPTRFEQVIGRRDENGLPAVRIELSGGATVLLTGKIDRVDLYRDENDRVFVRVVDYKTGKHTFSLDEVRSGMDIQLVLYLYALLASDPTLRAAGAHYLFASTEAGHTEIKRSGFFLEDADVLDAADGGSGYAKKLEKQSAAEIDALGKQMCDTVKEIAERILAGDAEKTPSEDACAFCAVRDNCAKAYRQ